MKSEAQRHPINSQINASIVRLIGEKGEQVGVVSMEEALQSAREAGLDLVQVAESNPVVCRLMDYSKHLFELKKRRGASRKKQRRTQVKEIKFRPGTEKADYAVKVRNLTRFLESGDKAKVTIRFRGREMAHQELGTELLERVREDLKNYGSVEQEAKQEGRQMAMVLSPHGKKRTRVAREGTEVSAEESAAEVQTEEVQAEKSGDA